MKKSKLLNLLLCGIFAAISAILAQLIIPLGPVPINMVHISILVSAGLLGAKYAAISQIMYVLLGAASLPVFSGFRGGVGHIVGPTGGFLFGYIVCAFVAGLIIDRYGRTLIAIIPAMIIGVACTYLVGITWYMHLTGAGLAAALMVCVVPFLIGDSLKILLSAFLIIRLSPILKIVLTKD